MKKGSIPHQIIGSFEDIGKSIATETLKVPGELAQTAFETKGQPNKAENYNSANGEAQPNSGLQGGETLKKLTEAEINEAVARKALMAISTSSGETQPELSVYEEHQRENEAAKIKADQDKAAFEAQLKPLSTKPKFGKKNIAQNKKTNVEVKRSGAD